MLGLIALPVSLALHLAGAARADDNGYRAVGLLESKVWSQLQSASQPGAGAQAFDGSVKRRDGDLEILSEEKNVLIKTETIPGYRGNTHDCDDGAVGPGSSGCGPGLPRRSYVVPPKTYLTYGDIQKVRIYDRKQYQEHSAQRGSAIGAAIGLLVGFPALFAGPVGLAIGTCAVIAGIAVGHNLAWSEAAQDPEVFERTINEHTVLAGQK